jgi:hypothetical protein
VLICNGLFEILLHAGKFYVPESTWAILRLVYFRACGELREPETKQRDSRENYTQVVRQRRDGYCTEIFAKSQLILNISGDCRGKNYCEHYEHQHE